MGDRRDFVEWEEAVRRTIRGMLPKNRLGRQQITKLEDWADPVKTDTTNPVGKFFKAAPVWVWSHLSKTGLFLLIVAVVDFMYFPGFPGLAVLALPALYLLIRGAFGAAESNNAQLRRIDRQRVKADLDYQNRRWRNPSIEKPRPSRRERRNAKRYGRSAKRHEKRRAKRRERRMAGMAKRRGRRRSSPG
jgi:hypothetical protein